MLILNLSDLTSKGVSYRESWNMRTSHSMVAVVSSAFLDKDLLVQQRMAVQVLRVLETTNEGLQPQHAFTSNTSKNYPQILPSDGYPSI